MFETLTKCWPKLFKVQFVVDVLIANVRFRALRNNVLQLAYKQGKQLLTLKIQIGHKKNQKGFQLVRRAVSFALVASITKLLQNRER